MISDNLGRNINRKNKTSKSFSISFDTINQFYTTCDLLGIDKNQKAEELLSDYVKNINQMGEIKGIEERIEELKNRKSVLEKVVNQIEEKRDEEAYNYLNALFRERKYDKEDSKIGISRTPIAYLVGQLESRYGIKQEEGKK